MSHRILTLTLLVFLGFVACKNDPKPPEPTTAAASADTLDHNKPLPNPWKDAACDLIADQEFFGVFGIEEKRDFANRRTLPGQSYCLRTWKKSDWRDRETMQDKNPNVATNPESAFITQVIDYGTLAVASAQYDMHKRDRISGYAQEVPDLGEGALWSESQRMLLVKKGHLFLQLKLDHADAPADDLTKLKELAAIALKKM